MEVIKEWWAIIMAVTGVGVWLVRLEASAKAAMREIERIDKKIERDRENALEARKDTNDMLREVRSDIKRLLERNRP